MRSLLKLNPYLARYRWHLLLGTVFIVLSNLFAVYSPQVVREAIDLISSGLAQMEAPPEQRMLRVPATLQVWVGWTGIDLQGRLNELHDADAIAGTVQPDDKAVADQVVAAHAVDLDQVLDSDGLGRGHGGEQQEKKAKKKPHQR